jgi:hypothetical protein
MTARTISARTIPPFAMVLPIATMLSEALICEVLESEVGGLIYERDAPAGIAFPTLGKGPHVPAR